MKDNRDIFRRWVYYRTKEFGNVTLSEPKEDTYYISYNGIGATMSFLDNGFVEETIADRYGDAFFYLSYKFKHYPMAVSFYDHMMRALTNYHQSSTYMVLLCCSGGMTSTYFKQKMNRYLVLAGVPVRVSAASVNDVPYIGEGYDAILVAPQMRSSVDQVQADAPHCAVAPIAPAVFATYDCAALYDQIARLYQKTHPGKYLGGPS